MNIQKSSMSESPNITCVCDINHETEEDHRLSSWTRGE